MSNKETVQDLFSWCRTFKANGGDASAADLSVAQQKLQRHYTEALRAVLGILLTAKESPGFSIWRYRCLNRPCSSERAADLPAFHFGPQLPRNAVMPMPPLSATVTAVFSTGPICAQRLVTARQTSRSRSCRRRSARGMAGSLFLIWNHMGAVTIMAIDAKRKIFRIRSNSITVTQDHTVSQQ